MSKSLRGGIYRAFLGATLGLGACLAPVVGAGADYPAPGDFLRGSQTWAQVCGRCHNIRGPEDLRDDQWITTMFHMRIRAGLTGQQTRDVLTFLQVSNNRAAAAASGGKGVASAAAEPPAQSGAEIYAKTCIACHGPDGKGAIPGAPDFTAKDGPLSKPDGLLIQHMIGGFQSPGSPMAMPPKGGNPSLTNEDFRVLLEYLRAEFAR